MDAGTEKIINQLQATLGKAAAGDAARQIIAEEVATFLREGGGAEAEDIGALEGAVRCRLAGRAGASGRTEKLAAKKSLFSRDEWSSIALYVGHMAREDEKRAAAALAARKRETRAQLQGQMAVTAQIKSAEKQQKKAELVVVESELQQFEQEEKAVRAQRKAEVTQLRTDREEQLQSQAARHQVAAELRRRGEEALSVQLALDLKRQMEAEAAVRAKAKADLKAFLLANEENKKIKEEEARRERELDQEYMRAGAAQLDKQEQDRQMLLERVKAVQNNQAADAAQRPPFKRWLAEEIIERQFQEKQAALAAEEAKRKAAAAASAAQFRAGVAAQVGEKAAARLAAAQAKRAELVQMMAELQLCKETEAAAKAGELQRMAAFKAELDAQIAADQARREVAAMSDTERKLNAKLLREAEAAAAAGVPGIRAIRSPAK